MDRGLEVDIAVRRSDLFELRLQLSIAAGRTVALLGPNGAGKSTAVGAVAGLIPIDSGRISLNGFVMDDPGSGTFVPSEERRVGVVFQDYLLFPHLSVIENVAFGLRSRGEGRTASLARAREWLAQVDLGDAAQTRPADLSGGQAQRVALARALATEPDVLLLDEPLSALDVTTRSELRRALADHLEAFEGPRLVITHDAAEASLLADEVHVIEDGSVTQRGTLDEIRLRPRTRYAADLAGSNLVSGMASAGVVTTGEHTLQVADDELTGPVLVTIAPAAVSVHNRRPDGSPRNSWQTTVERVEHLGPRVRLLVGPPLPLTVEITEASSSELHLDSGSEIWVAIKATEIGVELDQPSND